MRKCQTIVKCAGCPKEFKTTQEVFNRGRKFHSMDCYRDYMIGISTQTKKLCLNCFNNKYLINKNRLPCPKSKTTKHKYQ